MSNLTFKPKSKRLTVSFERISGDVIKGENQVRDFTANGANKGKALSKSREHIEGLTTALSQGGILDPISVHKDEKLGSDGRPRYTVIDGHHRLQAYKEAYRLGLITTKRVRCKELLDIDRKEAKDYALKTNLKDTLNMTPQEKYQATWINLWMNWDELKEKSLRDLASHFEGNVGRTTLGKMRKTVKHLLEEEAELYSYKINSDKPSVEPWRLMSTKYKHLLDSDTDAYEQAKLKAEITISTALTRLTDSKDWRLLDDSTKEKLAKRMLGWDFTDEEPEVSFDF
ncbi:ParB/RepB/Spo0J family partition protein [Thiomicrorhabdus sp. Kp2]|uniref:ParB/RepB/Spo0J family partition protein n=1 Tax=Thiomicrorhabdus sp. Kp2 TaxID=1123518 RepID=UPI0004273C02|nr:ParB/RepB/Spo0J family partition protein [Thiomicrorhabdus sp. Kp2]